MKSYVSVEEAADLLLEKASAPARFEEECLLDALHRVAFEDVDAGFDQPPFDRSPLDGYAVCHADLAGAGADAPARLRITQNICAGDAPKGPIARKEAARIMTGAPIPQGADCVVRQEDTRTEGGCVLIFTSLNSRENYCCRGEDILRGRSLIRRGDILDAARLGVLAGQGHEKVKVFPKPGICISSVGD